jgi:hypothetical protein
MSLSPSNPMLAVLLFIMLALLSSSRANAQEAIVEDYRIGNFESASSIDIDPFGNIFVSDRTMNMVFKYSIRGEQLASIGGQGWSNNEFDEPMGLDASLGVSIYVSDYNNNRVSRFDKDLNFLGSFSTQDDPNQELEFGYPRDVAVSQVGDLFVLDEENQQVLYTSGFASIQFVFGGVESGEMRLQGALALATGPNDNVYVLEANRVAAFDVFGNPVRQFATDTFTDAVGIAVYGSAVFVVTTNDIYIYSHDGSYKTTIKRSSLIFANETGEFRDIAITRERILLLTERSIIVFPNPFNN